MTAYSPECETCTRCHEPGCFAGVCLKEDAAALLPCGEVACEEHQGEGHVCELGEVPC